MFWCNIEKKSFTVEPYTKRVCSCSLNDTNDAVPKSRFRNESEENWISSEHPLTLNCVLICFCNTKQIWVSSSLDEWEKLVICQMRMNWNILTVQFIDNCIAPLKYFNVLVLRNESLKHFKWRKILEFNTLIFQCSTDYIEPFFNHLWRNIVDCLNWDLRGQINEVYAPIA